MRVYLHGREAMAVLVAEALDDDALVREVTALHELARLGYSDSDGLKQLAAVALTLSRRIDRRPSLGAA
jgi:hypothetical protein